MADIKIGVDQSLIVYNLPKRVDYVEEDEAESLDKASCKCADSKQGSVFFLDYVFILGVES